MSEQRKLRKLESGTRAHVVLYGRRRFGTVTSVGESVVFVKLDHDAARDGAQWFHRESVEALETVIVGERGRIVLELPPEAVDECSAQGDVTGSVEVWASVPVIEAQLRKLDADEARQALKETGGWQPEELQDHEKNLRRVLWLAACDAREQRKETK